MKTLSIGKVLLAALVLVAGSTLVQAEDFPNKGQVTSRSEKTLTDRSLGTLIEGMGYDFRTEKYENGTPYYYINQPDKKFTYYVRATLSHNKKVLWLSVNVSELPSADRIDAEKLLSLLEKNGTTLGKAHFRKSGKYLVIGQPVENQDITPAKLRAEIEDLMRCVRDTEALVETANLTRSLEKITVVEP